VWTASLAHDLKDLRDRARQDASEGAAADASAGRIWRAGGSLETRRVNARTGAERFQSQRSGSDCSGSLRRRARGSCTASLEVRGRIRPPTATRSGRRRRHGAARLRQDPGAAPEGSRALSEQWKRDPAGGPAWRGRSQGEIDGLRRRHTVVLESEAADDGRPGPLRLPGPRAAAAGGSRSARREAAGGGAGRGSGGWDPRNAKRRGGWARD